MRRHGVDLCAQPAAAVAKRLMLSFFVGIGTVLVGSHNGAVDHRVFVVAIAWQVVKDALPDPGFGPATEPSLRVLPVAESLRQVAPRYSGAVLIQDRLDEAVRSRLSMIHINYCRGRLFLRSLISPSTSSYVRGLRVPLLFA